MFLAKFMFDQYVDGPPVPFGHFSKYGNMSPFYVVIFALYAMILVTHYVGLNQIARKENLQLVP